MVMALVVMTMMSPVPSSADNAMRAPVPPNGFAKRSMGNRSIPIDNRDIPIFFPVNSPLSEASTMSLMVWPA